MQRTFFALVAVALPVVQAAAQGTAADYARAANVAQRIDAAVIGLTDAPTWLSGDRFWYRKELRQRVHDNAP